MARDIEDFLRKAAERRAQAQRGGQPAPQQPAPQQPAPPPPRRADQPPRQERRVFEALVIDDSDAHSDSRPTTPVASGSLIQPVDQADEKLESHLNQVFDHDLGSLRHGDTRSDKDARSQSESKQRDDETVTDELVRMLKDPQSLSAAIILKEILDRPAHRW